MTVIDVRYNVRTISGSSEDFDDEDSALARMRLAFEMKYKWVELGVTIQYAGDMDWKKYYSAIFLNMRGVREWIDRGFHD